MSSRSRPEIKIGTGWLANLCGQFLPFLGFFCCAPVLASTLGGDRFGVLMLLAVFPQIAGQLDLGMATTGTRLLAHYAAQQQPAFVRRVFAEAVLGLGMLGVLFAAALVVLSQPLIQVLHLVSSLASAEQADRAVEVMALWVCVTLLGVAAALVLRANQQYRTLSYVQAGSGLAFWIGAALLAWMGQGVPSIVLWGAVTGLVSVCALLWCSRRWLSGEGSLPSGWLIPKAWRYGAGAFTAQASSLLTYHLDKLLVGALVSPAAAGVYTSCANLAGKLLAVIAAISTFSFPQTAVLHARGDVVSIQKMLVEGTRLNVTVALVFGVPAIALAEPFLRLWLGAAIAAEYSSCLAILILGYLLASGSVVAANVASGMGDSRTPAIFAVIGGGGTLLLCLWLAPGFGALGAAIAAMLGMSQALVFCMLIARRVAPGSLAQLGKMLWPSLLASLFIGTLLKWLSFHVEAWVPLLFLAGSGALVIAGVGMSGHARQWVTWMKGLRE